MRVLSIVPHSLPAPGIGGAERQAHHLHQGLVARGVEVHVLADIQAVGRAFQEFEGTAVWGVPFPVLTAHALRPGNIKLWTAWRRLRRVVTAEIPRPDIIQVTTFREPAMIGCWLAAALDVPWIVRVACSGSHGDFKYICSNWLTRHQLPSMVATVSAVVAIDNQTRDEAASHGVPPDRIRVIPNSLILRREPASQPARHAIVFVGRLAPQKRVETLVDAYSMLCRDRQSPPDLLIAGDGELEAPLEQHAHRAGVAGRCRFLGAVPGPEDVLDQALCFVNPSESEGLPNAVLEALAFGVPVILSDIRVHRDLATAVGMQDFLFPPGDAAGLKSSLQRFLDLDPEQQRQLARRSQAYASRFTAAARDAAFVQLHREILGPGVAPGVMTPGRDGTRP